MGVRASRFGGPLSNALAKVLLNRLEELVPKLSFLEGIFQKVFFQVLLHFEGSTLSFKGVFGSLLGVSTKMT